MKYYLAAIAVVATISTNVRAETKTPQAPQSEWVCVARTAVLQKAFTGKGPSKAEASAAALEACQDSTPIGCYVERCDETL